jgi:exodeoxyribonuclease VII large subunit
MEDRAYTVSEITDRIRSLLEESYPVLTIEGEISNFRPSSSGHYYFTMKDSGASIQAVMFKNRIRGLGFEPADGMLVRAIGSLSVYPQRGSYQIICEGLVRAGTGDILAMLEERKRRLAAEGCFDEARKRPIPRFPARVAVITSPTGAAIRDILSVLKRRNSGIRVTILPALVQGAEAAETVARQIGVANRYRLGDVIIVARGGGSIEDMLPFSDEGLVRAIVASELPVISAVGHEVDVSLSDLAADLRAATPSAAAELVAASRDELDRRVGAGVEALEQAIRRRVENVALLLKQFSPDNLEMRFAQIHQPLAQRLDDAMEALLRGLQDTVIEKRHRIELLASTIEASSPMAILERGFSVVTKQGDPRPIASSENLAAGDLVSITFASGTARARAEEIGHEEIRRTT